MLFAAGLGTRLKPLTDHCPKALVRINGLTPLDITLERLRRAGATEVVVNVHHFGEQIIEHLSTRDFDMSIKISDERDTLLDTGGGLRKAPACSGRTESPFSSTTWTFSAMHPSPLSTKKTDSGPPPSGKSQKDLPLPAL